MAGQFDAPPLGSVVVTDAHITGTLSPSKVTGTAVVTNDSRLSDARQLAAGADKTKLDGIQTGAEVNVNADWNAGSGDAQILNKPTIPTQYTDEMAQEFIAPASPLKPKFPPPTSRRDP